MISMIDNGVGRIMAHLNALDLAKDTIVIFMGDHGLMLKASLHFQGLIRVPFIWSEPGMSLSGRSRVGQQN